VSLKRKALLIGNSKVTPPLPGVEKDLLRYENFLITNYGGAWNNSEIIVSLNDDYSTLLTKKNNLNGADYSFVLIAGHGRHEKNQTFSGIKEETCLWINENDTIPVSDLFPTVRRCTILVDVCRNIVHIMKAFSKAEFYTEAIKRRDGLYLTREEYRNKYDRTIINCPENRIIMYSCNIDQTAGDDGDGGVFSNNMLNTVKCDNRGSVIDILTAFNFAKIKTLQDHYPQNPQINYGRTREFFPFGLT